jgi:hypothetical protein
MCCLYFILMVSYPLCLTPHPHGMNHTLLGFACAYSVFDIVHRLSFIHTVNNDDGFVHFIHFVILFHPNSFLATHTIAPEFKSEHKSRTTKIYRQHVENATWNLSLFHDCMIV